MAISSLYSTPLVTLLAVTLPALEQPEQTTSTGSRVVSPSVVATTIARIGDRRTTQLELIVLWRGSPGWFLGAADGSSTWQRNETGSRTVDQAVVHRVSFGSRPLVVTFFRDRHAVRIGDGELAPLPDGANAVLVDNVDSPDGPVIVNTVRLESNTIAFPARIEPLLGASPDLMSFLRCEAPLPDAGMNNVVRAIVCQPAR